MNSIIKNNLPQIKKLFKTYGANEAYLFGSAAINTMNADSDVDFLFQFSKDINYEVYATNYFELLYALQDLLKLEVDLVAIETLSNPFLIQKIESQKIKII